MAGQDCSDCKKKKREAIIKKERQNGGEIESNRKERQRRERERGIKYKQSYGADVKDSSGRDVWRVGRRVRMKTRERI